MAPFDIARQLLSASNLIASSLIIAIASCAVLGVGFFATIRSLVDILVVFYPKALEQMPTYQYYMYANRDKYLAGIGMPEGVKKKRKIDELHVRVKV